MGSAKSDEPAARPGLSLYAKLLESESSNGDGSVPSSAPTKPSRTASQVFEETGSENAKSQISSAALRFQPTKRPQITSFKAKSRSKPTTPAASSTNGPRASSTAAQQTRSLGASTLTDWLGDGQDGGTDDYAGREKRQRGGKKKRKRVERESVVIQDCDEIYDPSRPNIYEQYLDSDEKYLDNRDWKDRLYAHRVTRSHGRLVIGHHTPQSVAPPAHDNALDLQGAQNLTRPPADATLDLDENAEDVLARRATLPFGPSQNHDGPSSPSNSQSSERPPPSDLESATISKAPVMYSAASSSLRQQQSFPTPNEPEILKAQEAQGHVSASSRPGQKDFARRLMEKYGWSKGTGLGARGSGIVNALSVKVEKRKQDPDAANSDRKNFGAIGKIISKNPGNGSGSGHDSKFGSMSDVVELKGMLDGMDIDREIDQAEGGLVQEIGEECNASYGTVERVFIHRSTSGSAVVYVKFTSELSALRAVNALHDRIFNGNKITARFFDTDRFNAGGFG